jgi:hypothetical protein
MEQEKTVTLTFTESELRLLWSCVYGRRADLVGDNSAEMKSVKERLTDLLRKVDHTRYPER